MQRQRYEDLETAKDTALNLLRSEANIKGGGEFDEYIRKNGKGEVIFYRYMLNEEDSRGGRVYLNPVLNVLLYFPLGEWERKSLPFQRVTEEEVLASAILGSVVTKPAKRIDLSKPMTKVAETIWQYTGGEDYEIRYENGLGEPQLFELVEWEDADNTTTLELNSTPYYAEKRSGIAVRTMEDYAKAVESLKGEPLTEMETKEVEGNFLFYRKFLFQSYCLYEFMVTEQYSTLVEALGNYEAFGLPDTFAKEIQPIFECKSIEDSVISVYLSPNSAVLKDIGVNIRELSKATGIPLAMLYRNYNTRNSLLSY